MAKLIVIGSYRPPTLARYLAVETFEDLVREGSSIVPGEFVKVIDTNTVYFCIGPEDFIEIGSSSKAGSEIREFRAAEADAKARELAVEVAKAAEVAKAVERARIERVAEEAKAIKVETDRIAAAQAKATAKVEAETAKVAEKAAVKADKAREAARPKS